MYKILIGIIVLLVLIVAYMYIRTSRILKRVDEMIDSAMDDRFIERNFTERRISRLESKMHRYLSSGKILQNQIIEERNAVKSLVSDISHQTKTPISNILLYTQLLSEVHSLDNSSKEVLSQIENQTEKLSFLIQSLVKLSRLENGTVSVSPKENSVRHLLDDIDYTAEAEKKCIKLIVEDIPDITAVFDLKWTGEAISNIIDNAIKYTPNAGTVTVSAREYEMFVRIDIADTGIGMNEEETAKIFTRFYRSPSVSDEKGVGIGLYLAKEILSKQSSYIKVSSKLNKGSVFSVFLSKK